VRKRSVAAFVLSSIALVAAVIVAVSRAPQEFVDDTGWRDLEEVDSV
jgi:hypothetical protein